MLSSQLIRATTPSALNRKNISMNALCRPTKQATRTSVGFHARTTMITPFLVDDHVEFGIQMAFHAITCALWSSHTELRAWPKLWWHTSHWRKQYPADSVVRSTVGIDTIRNTAASAKTNDLDFKLCPPYSAGRKGGRLREEKRIKGAIEIAIEKRRRRRRRQRKLRRSVTQLSLRMTLNIGP